MLFTFIIAKALHEREKPHLAGKSLLTCVALEGLGVLPPCVHKKKYDACCIVMISKIGCYIPMLLRPLIVKIVEIFVR